MDNDLYRTLIENTYQPVSIIQLIFNEIGDPVDYITLYMNPAAEAQLGLKREETIGRRAKEISPSAEQEWFTRYGEVVKTGISASFERYSSTFNKYFNNQLIPLGNEKIGILFQDITALRVSEETKKNAIEALRESERKALALVEELEKANQNKTKFLNMLSHELRNPLASIMISLDLMDKLIPEGQRNYKALEIAKRQGKQLTNLVDDLLDVTRITEKKITQKKETLELNELINHSVQDYQQQFADKNVRLELRLTAPLFLEADPSRITQAIGNLLHNAGKFTRSNDLVTVEVSQEKSSNEAVITVQDTGRGIDSKDLENLFEPFMQVDKTLARSNGGLGLGLAIVKGIVELYGGRVEASSEGIDKGTKFTIKLPLPKGNVSIQEFSAKPDTKSNKSLKILIIDDNKDLAEMICELIGFLGYETECAHNGGDGIAKARELQPDVIICDIGLPDMSGYEVVKMICKDAEFKDTFLIALSGYAQQEDIDRSKEAGFDRHLGKPVSMEMLQTVLNEVR